MGEDSFFVGSFLVITVFLLNMNLRASTTFQKGSCRSTLPKKEMSTVLIVLSSVPFTVCT